MRTPAGIHSGITMTTPASAAEISLARAQAWVAEFEAGYDAFLASWREEILNLVRSGHGCMTRQFGPAAIRVSMEDKLGRGLPSVRELVLRTPPL
jgi:hypothetical protein